jgi:hypothetical protein
MADVNVTSTSTDTVDVVGLDNLKADLKLELPQPLKTDSKTDSTSTLEIKPLKADLGTTTHLEVDPLKTDSSVSLDLKPVVVDLCLNLGISKVPSVCVNQPYRHHIGFTMWGTEVWGFTFSGEQETVVREYHPGPKLALGRSTQAWRPRPTVEPERELQSRESGGLRIRLGP